MILDLTCTCCGTSESHDLASGESVEGLESINGVLVWFCNTCNEQSKIEGFENVIEYMKNNEYDARVSNPNVKRDKTREKYIAQRKYMNKVLHPEAAQQP